MLVSTDIYATKMRASTYSCTNAYTHSLANATACIECAVGTYSNNFSATSCVSCPPGSAAGTTGSQFCPPCDPGTYSNTSGLSVCFDCVAGTVSGNVSGGATACDSCIPGSFAGQPRMQSCELCHVGTYIDTYSGTSCITCPQGRSTQGLKAGLDGRPHAVPEFFNALEACRPFCQAGTFSIWGVQPLGPDGECRLCPAGYFTPQNASTSCSQCQAGAYSKTGASICKACEPGKVSQAAQQECQACLSGTYAHQAGMSACVPCGQDTFSEQSGSTVCTVCPSVVGTGVTNTMYIKDCRSHCGGETTSSRGALLSGNCCVNVSAEESSVDWHKIVIESDKYSLTDLEDAINKAVERKLNVTQLLHLELNEQAWSAGRREGNFSAVDLFILHGGFQLVLFDPTRNDDEQPTLDECETYDPALYYMCDDSQLGSMLGFNGYVPASGPTVCHESTATYLDDGGCYSAYRATAPNSFVNLFTRLPGSTNSNECQDFCVEGKYSADGLSKPDKSCLVCNSGNFSSFKGQSACSECQPGSFSPTSGAQASCTLCEKGTKGPTAGATTCYRCSSGTFAPFQALSLCYDCTPGTYSNTSAYPDTCLECPASYFSNASALTSCSACGHGTYTSGFGASACSLCAPGTYLVHSRLFDNNLTTTEPPRSGRATKCNICKRGTFSELPSSSTRCVTCAAGSFSLDKQSSCALCSAGTFSGNGSSACLDCQPGSSSGIGMSTCITCAPGSFSPLSRQAQCTLCEPGTFNDLSNQTACRSCDAGTFAGENGMTACKLCGYGSYASAPETTSCTACAAEKNTTGLAKTLPTDCIKYCPAGESGYNGVEPCTSCAPGKFAGKPGTHCVAFESIETLDWDSSGIRQSYISSGTCVPNACPLCAAGKFASNSSATVCSICPVSFYSGTGQSECTKCKFGLVTLEPGRPSASFCIAFCSEGSFSNTTMAPCFGCHPGKYQSKRAQTTCFDCSQGSYMPRYYAVSCAQCPHGKGTVSTGALHQGQCVGWAAKYLNPSFCTNQHTSASSSAEENGEDPEDPAGLQDGAEQVLAATREDEGLYLQDEGALSWRDMEVVVGGSDYVPGLAVFNTDGAPGTGGVATFSVDEPGGAVSAVQVVHEGEAYTSTGSVSAYFASMADPLLAAKRQDGSVTRVIRAPFVNLIETPDTFMSGCVAGALTVPESESAGAGGRGFIAYYTADSSGAIDTLCIGEPSGSTSNPSCHRRLQSHGQHYAPNPPLLVHERAISRLRIRPGSVTRGCRRSGSLRAAVGDTIAPAFAGAYTANLSGSLEAAQVTAHDAWMAMHASSSDENTPGLSVFPADSDCRCGTGIEGLAILSDVLGNLSTGRGFVPSAMGTAFAAASVPAAPSGASDGDFGGVHVSSSGRGFVGTFRADSMGRVEAVSVVRGGEGYHENVSVVLCPAGTSWNDSQWCCYRALERDWRGPLPLPLVLQGLVYNASSGCFDIEQPRLQALIGKPGGTPGSFDACLEAVVDHGQCRCGSGLEQVIILDGGAGYVDGPVYPLFDRPACCSDALGCLEGYHEQPPATFASNSSNHSQGADEDWCGRHCHIVTNCVPACSNHTCLQECWRQAQRAAGNYTAPFWCAASGANFAAQIETIAAEDPDASGRATKIMVQSAGAGFNASTTRLALMYPPGQGHRCCAANDATCPNETTACEQDGTISRVLLAGNASVGNVSWDGVLYASCEGVAQCTGSGLQGRCHVQATGICHLADNCLPGTNPQGTRTCPGPCGYVVTNISLSNHGSGYNAAAPPRLLCAFPTRFANVTLFPPACDQATANDTVGPCSESLHAPWRECRMCKSDAACRSRLEVIRAGLGCQNWTSASGLSRTEYNVSVAVGPGLNLSASGDLPATPIIPAGLRLRFTHGRSSGVSDGGHAGCLYASVPQGPLHIERGPLAGLQRRLLGSAADSTSSADHTSGSQPGQSGDGGGAREHHHQRQLLMIDKTVLRNDRLHWFLRAATGADAIQLTNAECLSRRGMRPLAAGTHANESWATNERVLHRSLECVGSSAVFGPAAALLSVTFFEVTELATPRSPDPSDKGGETEDGTGAQDEKSATSGKQRYRTQVHMTLLKIDPDVNRSTPLQPLHSLAPLSDLPATSWLRHLLFPAAKPPSDSAPIASNGSAPGANTRPFFVVQACSAPFALHYNDSLLLRKSRVPSDLGDFALLRHPVRNLAQALRAGCTPEGGFVFLPGFALSASSIALTQMPQEPFLGNLARIMPKLSQTERHGTVAVQLDGFLALAGCEWPSTDAMQWMLQLDAGLLFCDAAFRVQGHRALVQIDIRSVSVAYRCVCVWGGSWVDVHLSVSTTCLCVFLCHSNIK